MPGRIVPLNRSYKPAVRKRATADGVKSYASLVKTNDGAAYFKALAFAILRAKASCPAWPRDIWQPTAVRLSVYLYDTRVDVGAATKAVGDAGERILYENDRIVELGEQPRPRRDGSGTRLVAVFELLAIDTPDVAAARRTERVEDRIKRTVRRLAKKRA